MSPSPNVWNDAVPQNETLLFLSLDGTSGRHLKVGCTAWHELLKYGQRNANGKGISRFAKFLAIPPVVNVDDDADDHDDLTFRAPRLSSYKAPITSTPFSGQFRRQCSSATTTGASSLARHRGPLLRLGTAGLL